ncbi:LOW QUALITY PROTEIN: pinin [Drosophila subobscura]|uniref:LOW QUALITY PROTEIN: pinin n=1 Tax=Drosophila subobscura TaxID=7241 RepID=UPI00155B4044|nr:LOW QUALITY PROTEIN: pinin [Drosophila subobscura]
MVNDCVLSSVDDVEQKLVIAKQNLITLNDNIRRFVGRVPKELRIDKHKHADEVKKNEHNERSFKDKRRSFDSNYGDARFPTDESEPRSARINSRVIRELPSRKEVVEAQGTDSESIARNRRMFGSLIGTLQKFCQEESRLKIKEDKKAEIEKKLERQELQERTMLRKERETLFLNKKRKQFEIRALEYKMARLKDFKSWESTSLTKKNQIRTKTKPHLFFRPQIHTPRTEKLLLECKTYVECFIQSRREELHAELRDMERLNYIKMHENNEIDESIYEEQYDEMGSEIA